MVRAIYWFRTDLRLHDSPALKRALDLKPEALFPLWCWDPNYVYRHRVGVNRFRFLLESMQDLSSSITRINPLSQLLVVRGDPALLLPELFKRWEITHLVFEKDVNGYSRRRDAEVIKIAKEAGVEVIAEHGHHLYDIEEIVKRHDGKAITSLKTLEGIVKSMDEPARPIEEPKKLPDPFLPKKSPKDLKAVQSDIHNSLDGVPTYHSKPGPPKVDYNSAELGGQRKSDGKVTCYDTVDGPDADAKKQKEEHFTVPTLHSLGMDPAASGASTESVVKGGEAEALKRLSELCKRKEYLATFAKPKTSPSCDTLEPSTTLLSPYIKFGCISIRRMLHDCQDAIKQYKGSKTSPPENLEGQLLFREMYACAELATGDAYQGIRGNKISRFMDWYLPNEYDKKSGEPIEPRRRGDDVSEKRLEAFRAGQTGFPWIDAGVRQLRLTGWTHHLMRHSLASFLTRGQCWISWERGAEMFEEWLLDWDPNANAGNWLWLSCSAFFSQFYRVYGLATFGQKYDKSGSLIRKYCPELKDYPDKYIWAPHTAPMDVQRKAKCIIGKDYPRPILDEKKEKEICLARMKACYAAKLYGTSKGVLDGTATAQLRKQHGQPDPQPPSEDPGRNDKIPEWAKAGTEAKTGAVSSTKDEEIHPEHTDQGDDGEEEENGKEEDEQDDDPKAGDKRKATKGKQKTQPKRGKR